MVTNYIILATYWLGLGLANPAGTCHGGFGVFLIWPSSTTRASIEVRTHPRSVVFMKSSGIAIVRKPEMFSDAWPIPFTNHHLQSRRFDWLNSYLNSFHPIQTMPILFSYTHHSYSFLHNPQYQHCWLYIAIITPLISPWNGWFYNPNPTNLMVAFRYIRRNQSIYPIIFPLNPMKFLLWNNPLISKSPSTLHHPLLQGREAKAGAEVLGQLDVGPGKSSDISCHWNLYYGII